MQEFNGCKGIWVHHMPHGYQHYIGGWIQSDMGKVCDVAGLDVGRDIAFANARLISSAPDLLRALMLIISYHDDGNVTLHEEDVKMAKDAINKALGK